MKDPVVRAAMGLAPKKKAEVIKYTDAEITMTPPGGRPVTIRADVRVIGSMPGGPDPWDVALCAWLRYLVETENFDRGLPGRPSPALDGTWLPLPQYMPSSNRHAARRKVLCEATVHALGVAKEVLQRVRNEVFERDHRWTEHAHESLKGTQAMRAVMEAEHAICVAVAPGTIDKIVLDMTIGDKVVVR